MQSILIINKIYKQIGMSIYSGFATRQDETNYNKLVCRLITTMQDHIIELCQGQIPPFFTRMQTYEQHKYLPPKFTSLLKPLQDAMKSSLMKPTKYEPIEFNMKLQCVKQEQQILSHRQVKKNLPMKKSALMNKKLIQRQQILGENYLKQNQVKKKEIQRSYSVFSQKKPKLQTQYKRTQKMITRQTMGDFNKNKRRNQLKSSSQPRQKIRNRKLLTQPSQKSIQKDKSSTNLREAFIIAANKK